MTTPDSPAAGPLPPGSRAENAWMFLVLLSDLASTPWHLLVFAFTRGRARRELAAALSAPPTAGTGAPR